MQGNMGMGGGPGGGMGGMGGGPGGGMVGMGGMGGPGGGMNMGGGMGGGMPGNMMGPMGNMMGNPMMNPMMGMGGMGDGGMFPMGMGMGMDMPMGGMNAMAMGGMPGMMGKGPMMPPGGPKGGMGGGPPKGGMGGGMKAQGGIPADKYCHKFYNSGTCDYGDNCKYAHIRPDGRGGGMPGDGGGRGGGGGGVRDTKQSAHKTRMCPQFSDKGFCKYGESCTFAHDPNELRRGAPGAVGGPMMPPMGGGPMPGGNQGRQGNAPKQGGGGGGGGGGGASNGGGNKRAFDAGGNDAKRQRTAAVPVPPAQESVPTAGSLGIHDLQQRFEALKAEAARFAAETGHTVAIFTVGGIISEAPESTADDYEGETYVKGVNASTLPDLKLSVLKYGTGGVCKQLTTRPEIVKFVCARGTKALSEIAAQEQINFSGED